MAGFQCINIDQAQAAMAGNAILLDIRDAHSFATRHVARAVHLHSELLAEFIRDTPRHTPLLILCYHGISSLNMAQYLIRQGFTDVYSVDGGIAAWQQQFPQDMVSETR